MTDKLPQELIDRANEMAHAWVKDNQRRAVNWLLRDAMLAALRSQAAEIAELRQRLADFYDDDPTRQATGAPMTDVERLIGRQLLDDFVALLPTTLNWSMEMRRAYEKLDRALSGYRETVMTGLDRLLAKEPTLIGNWRTKNGYLFCGTLRVAVADFDTAPRAEYRDAVLQDLCDAANFVVANYSDDGRPNGNV